MDQLKPAIIVLVLLSLVTGVVYPLVVTGIAQVVFPAQANGSLIFRDGKPVGSRLIGQPFDDPKYFWGRLSATAPFAYNAGASTGSNFGPLNPAFHAAAKARIDALRAADPPLSPSVLGMFRGAPFGQKASMDPWSHFPSSIVLYQRNLELFARDREELVEQIGVTLLHEVGHFLGLDEEDLARLGLD